MKQILFNTHFNAIIYLNGDITEGDINILKTINNSVVVIAADGALNQLNNISVDYVIGDLDSINDTTTSHNIIKDSNQNKYDFEKALDFAIANNYKNVLILGINGREYEHSINNWSIFIKYSKRINLCTFTKNRYGFLVSESINLQAKENEIISIIPATQTIISSKGLKWELNKTELKIGNSEGARNQAIQQNIEINLYSGEYILFVDARLPYIFNFEN